MDLFSIVWANKGVFSLLFVAMFVSATVSSPWFKGVVGEAWVKLISSLFLNKVMYPSLHDVTLKVDGETTQIDHIYFSKFGIFVVETKHMKGFIYANENHKYWLQKFPKREFKFQNPLHQNARHVRFLSELLGITTANIHSIIVFAGEAKLKGKVPDNVFSGMGFIGYIKSFKSDVFYNEQAQRFYQKVKQEQLDKGVKTKREHIRNLKQRHRR